MSFQNITQKQFSLWIKQNKVNLQFLFQQFLAANKVNFPALILFSLLYYAVTFHTGGLSYPGAHKTCLGYAKFLHKQICEKYYLFSIFYDGTASVTGVLSNSTITYWQLNKPKNWSASYIKNE